MYSKDAVLQVLLSDRNRFSDLVNAFLFEGRTVVRPEDVLDMDGTSLWNHQKKYRDLVKRTVCGTNIMIVGVENQDAVHYAMPVRVLSYDASEYDRQWKCLQKRHREQKDLKGAEFVSGFGREDKLRPVITLVVYYGERPWDGCLDLHGLIDWTDLPDGFRNLVGNYRIHLLEVGRYERLEYFQSDLRAVFGFVRYARDKEELKAFMRSNQEMLTGLEKEAYEAISILTGEEGLIEIEEAVRKEGGIDMCKAFDEIRQECREEGFNKGKAETMVHLLRRMSRKGMSPLETAGLLGMEEQDVRLILELDHQHPEESDERLLERSEAAHF